MMNEISDLIKTFLPKYLSSESTKELLDLFKEFPHNLDSRFFTSFLNNEQVIFQGDGLKNLPIVDLPNTTIKHHNCIIFSNTCDIDTSNDRFFPSSICYAPILKLSNYETLIRQKSQKTTLQIDNHIQDIRKQRITQILYLPPNAGLNYESIVFLDKINSISNTHIDRKSLNKLFVLSDYGLYVFLLKISIHFTRVQEKVDRFKGFVL